MGGVKAKWDVVVLGGANMDYLIRGTKLPAPGETVDGDEFLVACGGKGANQAVAAARLGAKVAFVGRVGKDDNGSQTIANLKREGVDVSAMQIDATQATGAALVMVDAQAEKQIFVAPGANQQLTVRGAEAMLRSARVLLLQFEVPMRTVLAAAKIAHRAGARIVLDPAPAAKPPAELLRLIHFIRPNSSEAEALTGMKVRRRVDARRAAHALFDRGVQAAAVQAGEQGDLVAWHDGEKLFPRLKVKSVDATGAGDAFVAAIAVALAEGKPFAEAGALANAAAALATTKFGAQTALPRREKVLRLLRRGT